MFFNMLCHDNYKPKNLDLKLSLDNGPQDLKICYPFLGLILLKKLNNFSNIRQILDLKVSLDRSGLDLKFYFDGNTLEGHLGL